MRVKSDFQGVSDQKVHEYNGSFARDSFAADPYKNLYSNT